MFLLGAVLTGAVLGFTADRVMTPHPVRKDQQTMRDRLARELDLTPMQRVAVDSILDERHRQLDEVMKPVKPKIDSIRLNFRAQLARQLTPEQQKRYYELIAEMEKSRQRE